MRIINLLLLAGCFALGPGIRGAFAQAASPSTASPPTPPPSAPAKRSTTELEKLAMPIALHPDPLISIILPASVYPVEIVLAARFVENTNNIAKLDTQPWDENVRAVAKFPELIAKMYADLEWTIGLGQAFLNQGQELMDTIQSLRLKAKQAGTLKDSPQQIVTVTNTVVERRIEQQVVVVTNTIVQIEPANPEVIYVPSYPATVYYPPPAYGYYWYGYYPYAPLVTFGAGMLWGAAIANWNHCNWHGGNVDIDINRNTNIGGNRPQPKTGDRASTRPAQQKWQANQDRLRTSGAATPKTHETRGWGGANGGRGGMASQRPATGAGGVRPSQQPALGGGAQRPATRPQQQPARSPAASQRPATAQRQSPSPSQRQGALGGVGSGGSSRTYSNRGSYSRGGGGFSGGRGGGGGGGGRRGGGRR